MALEGVARVVGRGLVAGAIGTAAITAAQAIAAKATNGGESHAPAEAAEKVVGIHADGPEERKRLNVGVHWAYGTLLGLPRSLMSALGMGGPSATMLHFGLVWGGAMAMLPSLDLAPPPWRWGAGELAKDGAMHAVYAVAAGAADGLMRG